MDHIVEKLRDCFHSLYKPKKREEAVEVSRKEAYFAYLYNVLAWEDPALTWTILIGLHFIFWLIVQLQIRLYCVLFLTTLVLFLSDTYFERSGLKAQRTEVSDTFRQAYNLFQQLYGYLKALRKDSPSTFCGTMCIACLVLSFVARNMSGYLIAYLLILGVFFGPLFISKLPAEYVDYVRQTLQHVTSDGLIAEQELIPFIAAKDFMERDVDLDSLLTDRTVDSLISGISTMPSHTDVDGASEPVLEEEDLEPNMPRAAYTPLEYSSDSDSDYRNLEIKSHLEAESSSEEEPKEDKSAGTVLNVLGEMGKKYVANLLKTNLKTKSSDSDSDFEFINPDEVNEQS